MKILALDTSTQLCSVAIVDNGELIAQQQSNEAFAHNGLLFEMLDALLNSTGISLKDVDLLAVGQGPGSFTGLRIGVSAWKSIAFAANLPLQPVCPLQALALQYRLIAMQSTQNPPKNVRVFLDARQNDAFTALYDISLEIPVLLDQIRVIERNEIAALNDYIHACGNLPEEIFDGKEYMGNTLPSAEGIGKLAALTRNAPMADKFFEPAYYKEFKLHKK